MYNTIGDQLEVLWSPEAYYADRKNTFLTLLVGQESGEIVGAEITGFRAYFLHCGVKIDEDHDELPPPTSEKQEQVERVLQHLDKDYKMSV
jgi:hypothetical protein